MFMCSPMPTKGERPQVWLSSQMLGSLSSLWCVFVDMINHMHGCLFTSSISAVHAAQAAASTDDPAEICISQA